MGKRERETGKVCEKISISLQLSEQDSVCKRHAVRACQNNAVRTAMWQACRAPLLEICCFAAHLVRALQLSWSLVC